MVSNKPLVTSIVKGGLFDEAIPLLENCRTTEAQ